jgi:hypothetical protein
MLATAEIPCAPLNTAQLWSRVADYSTSSPNIYVAGCFSYFSKKFGKENATKFPRWSPQTSSCTIFKSLAPRSYEKKGYPISNCIW